MAGQPGLFELDERYRALSAAGEGLERLARAVDFELFGRSSTRRSGAPTAAKADGRPTMPC